MNRRRPQPQLRSFESDDSTPRPPAIPDELEDAFFTRGQSEVEMIAFNEREREQADLFAARGRGSRTAYGIVAVGAMVILGLGLISRRAPRIATASAAPATTRTDVERAVPGNLAATGIETLTAQAGSDNDAVANLAAGAEVADDHAFGDNSAAADNADNPASDNAVADTGAVAAPPAPVSVRELRAGAAGFEAEPPPSTGTILAEEATAVEDAGTACAQLLRRGKFTEIKTTCGRAFATAPDPVLAVKVARNALERERYTEAQLWSRKAIELDAAHGEAFLTLGSAEQGLGHATLARTAYSRYLELEPKGAFADDVRALINSL